LGALGKAEALEYADCAPSQMDLRSASDTCLPRSTVMVEVPVFTDA